MHVLKGGYMNKVLVAVFSVLLSVIIVLPAAAFECSGSHCELCCLSEEFRCMGGCQQQYDYCWDAIDPLREQLNDPDLTRDEIDALELKIGEKEMKCFDKYISCDERCWLGRISCTDSCDGSQL
jgi:hypothetical protein